MVAFVLNVGMCRDEAHTLHRLQAPAVQVQDVKACRPVLSVGDHNCIIPTRPHRNGIRDCFQMDPLHHLGTGVVEDQNALLQNVAETQAGHASVLQQALFGAEPCKSGEAKVEWYAGTNTRSVCWMGVIE